MVISGERKGERGKIGVGIKRYKASYKDVVSVQHRECSQYFIISINGV